ncbi:MAG: M48 family metallopeptidase [Fervidobacterium sp.]|nr:M48 family metallopeptidase [Fervidobacterium sp.]
MSKFSKGILEISLEDVKIKVKVIKQKRNSYKIKVSNEKMLLLIVPPNAKSGDIINVLRICSNWIKQSFEKLQSQEKIFFDRLLNNSLKVSYLGEEINVRISEQISCPFVFTEKSILLHKRYLNNAKKIITYCLRKRAEEYLSRRTAELSKQTGLLYKKVVVKNTKSRWGSCSRRGIISLNWRLIMAPTNVIDYVIVHELAHTIQMNHSENFWRIVEFYKPDWKESKMWLKRNAEKLFSL